MKFNSNTPGEMHTLHILVIADTALLTSCGIAHSCARLSAFLRLCHVVCFPAFVTIYALSRACKVLCVFLRWPIHKYLTFIQLQCSSSKIKNNFFKSTLIQN